MFKPLLTVFALVMLTHATAYADIIFVGTEGEEQGIAYEDFAQIHYDGTDIVVEKSDGTSLHYAPQRFGICYFSAEAAALGTEGITDTSSEPTKHDTEEGIVTLSDATILRAAGDDIIVSSPKAAMLTVASADGRILRCQKVEAGRDERISLSAFPQGVYVVALNGQTLKIEKR